MSLQTPPNVGKSSVNLCQKCLILAWAPPQKRLILAWAPPLLNARSITRVCKRKFTMWRFWPIPCKQKFTMRAGPPGLPGIPIRRNGSAPLWPAYIRSGPGARPSSAWQAPKL